MNTPNLILFRQECYNIYIYIYIWGNEVTLGDVKAKMLYKSSYNVLEC